MKFAAVFVASVIASPAAMLLEFQTSESTAAAPEVCWKKFGGSDLKSATCAGDLFDGVCYEKCQDGATGFGPYCVQKNGDAFETKERHAVVANDAVCPADSKMVMAFDQSVCVQNSCPPAFPADCAVMCAKNIGVCTSVGLGTTIAIGNIVKKMQEGDWAAVIVGAKALYNSFKDVRPCNQVNQAVASEVEMIASFMQLLKMN